VPGFFVVQGGEEALTDGVEVVVLDEAPCFGLGLGCSELGEGLKD
jgi:hypothetical protein